MKLVIDIPQGMIDAFSHEVEWTRVLCRDMNTVLQNGTPYEERPKGTWLDNIVAFYWVCSECGAEVRSNLSEVYLNKHTLNYCPNCGAYMRDEGGSSNEPTYHE